MGLEKPSVHYVYAAYVSTEKLMEAKAEGRELIGPAPHSGGPNRERFQSDDFQVEVDRQDFVKTLAEACQRGPINTSTLALKSCLY